MAIYKLTLANAVRSKSRSANRDRADPPDHASPSWLRKRVAGAICTPSLYNLVMISITVEQAARRLGTLVGAALAGDDVVLDFNGRSVRLVPVPPVETPVGQPEFGSARGQIWMADDFDAPLDDFREYMEPAE